MLRNVCSYRTLMCGAAIMALLIQGPSRVFAMDLQSKEEIINLMLCYGAGADAIGDSTRNDPEGDGAAIYAECFTDDAYSTRKWCKVTSGGQLSLASTIDTPEPTDV